MSVKIDSVLPYRSEVSQVLQVGFHFSAPFGVFPFEKKNSFVSGKIFWHDLQVLFNLTPVNLYLPDSIYRPPRVNLNRTELVFLAERKFVMLKRVLCKFGGRGEILTRIFPIDSGIPLPSQPHDQNF